MLQKVDGQELYIDEANFYGRENEKIAAAFTEQNRSRTWYRTEAPAVAELYRSCGYRQK